MPGIYLSHLTISGGHAFDCVYELSIYLSWVPTTPACTWWNRPEEYNSSGKLESTHPSRTSVKSDQVFFGVESVMRVNADSDTHDSLLIRAAATSTSGTLNDLTTDLIMANNNNNNNSCPFCQPRGPPVVFHSDDMSSPTICLANVQLIQYNKFSEFTHVLYCITHSLSMNLMIALNCTMICGFV